MFSFGQGAAIAVGALLAAAPAAHAFDSQAESRNSAKRQERERIHQTPEYQQRLDQVGSQNREAALAKAAADPERNFLSNVCSRGERDCAGDVRLYDWQAKGYGVVEPVLFTARNGATLSGHVWATRSGPGKRPGVVITNGSIQAPEALYWFVAQTLAKAGYVVLTFDPQGQGQSDTPGEPPDQDEGVPAQTDGRPFFDGTVDALDFFLSTAQAPFRPRPSCETGTSHAPKQERRVAQGRNAAFNPFAEMVDSSRVGIAGHSYGARGVSYVGQWDPRVSAVVAWDRLSEPGTGGNLSARPCPADPDARREVPITKPALGMSADYFANEPRSSDPDPQEKAAPSQRYSAAGVDTGELAIRGGTHFEFSFLPTTNFDATLRGADLVAWYTTAWFDKYVKGDASADRRLRTRRWQSDAEGAAVDQGGDGNLFSFYFRSRLDIGLAGGGRFVCEDLRSGCDGMVSDDGEPPNFSYIRAVTTPDGEGGGAFGGIHGCGSRPHRVIRLRYRHVRIVKAKILINGRKVKVYRGKRLRRIAIPAAGSGRHRVRVVLRGDKGQRYVSVRTYNGCRKSRPRRIRGT